MRIPFLLLTLMWLAAGEPLQAQNSDLGFLAGISGPRSQVITGSTIYTRGSVGASGQINYAWQVLQHAVDLYVELPLVISGHDTGMVTPGTVVTSRGVDYFFTPGARLKISPQSRVSFYGAAGAGVASFGMDQVTVSRTVIVSSGRTNSAAFDFGGGLDFRLTRLLSLRVEGRDFVTRSGLGGSSGAHHGVFHVGIAFHF